MALSNIEEARFRLDDLLSRFGDTVQQSAKRASRLVARRESERTGEGAADVYAAAAAATAAASSASGDKSMEEQLAEHAEASRLETEQIILAAAFEQLSIDTFTYLSERRKQLLALLVMRLNSVAAHIIEKMEHNERASTSEITTRFDEQWSVLAVSLRPGTFKKYMEASWDALVDTLRERLMTVNPAITDEYVDSLVAYYHGGGEGLAREWMLKRTEGVRRLIRFNHLSSFQLIKFYWAQKRALVAIVAPARAPTTIRDAGETVATPPAGAAPKGDASGAASKPASEMSAEERDASIKMIEENMQFACAILRARAELNKDDDSDSESDDDNNKGSGSGGDANDAEDGALRTMHSICSRRLTALRIAANSSHRTDADGKPLQHARGKDREARAFIREIDHLHKKEKKLRDSYGGDAAMRAAAAAVEAHDNSLESAADEKLTPEERLRRVFMLPSTETIVCEYTCRCPSLPGSLGKLYVTTSHVCYAVRWGDDDDDSTPSTLVFQMEDVYAARVHAGWVTSELFLTVFDSKGVANVLEFNRMPKAKKALALIRERSKELGHEIEEADA